MKKIDLRSDTVTKPSKEMRLVMAEAEVGDDVYGEDPTVLELEKYGAALLGKESALFAPSGTQSNLVGLLSHCQRGDEYIVGQHAHTYKYEGGGAAVLGSIQPQPLHVESDGTLDLETIEAYIKPDDFHFAQTRLICLENTHNGLALPQDYFRELADLANQHDLKLHLDGARLFNAATHSETSPEELVRHFDSVSICLSKGLGAPAGSLLCGEKSLIERARRWRKVVGGGMRQAGILAAGGLFALQHNLQRLQEDHDNASLLAHGLQEIDGPQVSFAEAQTNMVFLHCGDVGLDELPKFLGKHHILINPGKTIRLVTHMDVDEKDIHEVIRRCSQFFGH